MNSAPHRSQAARDAANNKPVIPLLLLIIGAIVLIAWWAFFSVRTPPRASASVAPTVPDALPAAPKASATTAP